MSLVFEVACKFHNQDGVLTGEAREHEQRYLGEYIIISPHAKEISEEPNTDDRREYSHRHNQNHSERQCEAFILRSEHKEDQQNTEREDEDGGVACQNLLVGQLCPFEVHALWEGFFEDFCDGILCLSRRISRCGVAANVRRTETVIAHGGVWAEGFIDGDNGAEGDHVAINIARFKGFNILWRCAEFGISLGDDLERTAKLVEVINVE